MSESLASGYSQAVKDQVANLRQRALGVQAFVFDDHGVVSFSTEQERVNDSIHVVPSHCELERLMPRSPDSGE